MLLVDLYRLRRERRARIDADIPVSAHFWNDLAVEPASPLAVRLEAQQAGADVVVRGHISGTFRLECRRCLDPVVVAVEEELGRLYRAGDSLTADEPEDVVLLPEGGTLDLEGEVQEQVSLAMPQYAYCRDSCRGLCPVCGTNLNESSCGCTVEGEDERWAPLRRLLSDG